MKYYPLTSEQTEKRDVLALISTPGRFAFLSFLLSGENALNSRDVGEFCKKYGITRQTLSGHIMKPLKDARIIQDEYMRVEGGHKQYYIHPDASDFVQALLKLVFEESEAQA